MCDMSLSNLWTMTCTRFRQMYLEGTFSRAASESPSSILANVKCIIEPLSGREVESLGKSVGVVSHRMFCAYGTDIKARDTITDAAVKKYRVVSPAMDPAGRGHHSVLLLLALEES